MKAPKLATLFAVTLSVSFVLPVLAQCMEKVEYFADSIIEKKDSYIRLLGGSAWILSAPSLALVTDDVIIVFRTIELSKGKRTTVATANLDGEEIRVTHIGGAYATQAAYLTTVVEALADGALLRLADGTLLSIPQYDQFNTGWWMPPYKALLTANKLYLYNLKKGKRVWVNNVR